MTCIVALKGDNGSVIIGGDSAGVADIDIVIRKDPKVFMVDDRFIIGFTDSFRMGQILRYSFNPPIQSKEVTTYEYMVTEFITSLRATFILGGYLETRGGREIGGTFIVGYRGRLFTIGSDFQVGEHVDDYMSVGCGSEYALGALRMFTLYPHPPKDRAEEALKVAEYFSGGVVAPFTILTLDKEEE